MGEEQGVDREGPTQVIELKSRWPAIKRTVSGLIKKKDGRFCDDPTGCLQLDRRRKMHHPGSNKKINNNIVINNWWGRLFLVDLFCMLAAERRARRRSAAFSRASALKIYEEALGPEDQSVTDSGIAVIRSSGFMPSRTPPLSLSPSLHFSLSLSDYFF